MSKKTKQAEAIALRLTERLSLKDISVRLGVSKSSVSLWVRDYPLVTGEQVVCRGCGVTFTRLTGRSRPKLFCSKKCNSQAFYKRKPKQLRLARQSVATMCQLCRTVFKTKDSKRKFCDAHCRQNVKGYRRNLKQRAVTYKGGKCNQCGYDRCIGALDFHHLNPDEKDFSISSGGSLSWERIKTELDNCVLLCRNCHSELHYGLIVVV
jgi:5-methylcytosine-specific restriction endonuclease McrA